MISAELFEVDRERQAVMQFLFPRRAFIHPDILVTIEGVGEVYFELTDVSPEAEIRRRNVLDRTSDAFLQCLDELPVETQRVFDAKYSNAIIFPSMVGLRGDRDLRKHAPDALRTLFSLPDGFEGQWRRRE